MEPSFDQRVWAVVAQIPPGELATYGQIAELIGAEDPAKPLSDAAIAQRLAAEGVSIARRTVAKYRDALRIPPASARRDSA